MKSVVILSSDQDYWEACYVDGVCIDQAHHLGEGSGKIAYIRNVLNNRKLTLNDLIEVSAEEVDDNLAMETGSFPQKLEDLQGSYNFD